MDEPPVVKTMRLRHPGVCTVCRIPVEQGSWARYTPATQSVRCMACGPERRRTPRPAGPVGDPLVAAYRSGDDRVAVPDYVPSAWTHAVKAAEAAAYAVRELAPSTLTRSATCMDCGRPLCRHAAALADVAESVVLCLECVDLETVHCLGLAGGGARDEHARRQQRHHTKVATAHPRLGGLILALANDPSHVRAWQSGAVGEQEFGRRLSAISTEQLKVLHDRTLPGSTANIDHIAVTSKAVWVLDAKHYRGRIEARGHGLFSRQSPDLYVDGRNCTKLVTSVQQQVAVVDSVLTELTTILGLPRLPVRGGLVFIGTDFGLTRRPFDLDGVWVGWGKAARQQLATEADGPLPVGDIAKRLARELPAA